MSSYECSKPAYDRLVKTGLKEEIELKRKEIKDCFTYRDISKLKNYLAVIKKVKKKGGIGEKNPELNYLFKEINKFEKEDSNEIGWDWFGEKIMKNPSLLSYSILGEKIFKYKDYGFFSLNSLEQAVASYCMSEIGRDFDNSWVWRQKNYKNKISQNIHGDLHVGQIDVSEKEEENLFGELEFKSAKSEYNSNGFGCWQDWSYFLISILKYCKEIGKEKIPEILEWEEVMKTTGESITNTCEALYSNGENYEFTHSLDMNESVLFKRNNTSENIFRFIGIDDKLILPYLDEEKLVYFRIDNNGKIEFPIIKRRGNKIAEFFPEDIPDLLKANYKYFARDRGAMKYIMNSFIRENFKTQTFFN